MHHRVLSFLQQTMEQSKIDLDNYQPEWRKLMVIFNARYVGLASIKEKNDGYHLYLKRRSTLDLRRTTGDDLHRIRASEIRLGLGLEEPGDILFRFKTTFKVRRTKSGLRISHTKIENYEESDLRHVIALPMWEARTRGFTRRASARRLKCLNRLQVGRPTVSTLLV